MLCLSAKYFIHDMLLHNQVIIIIILCIYARTPRISRFNILSATPAPNLVSRARRICARTYNARAAQYTCARKIRLARETTPNPPPRTLFGQRSLCWRAPLMAIIILHFKRTTHCTTATQPDSSYLPSFTVATSQR